MLARNHFVSALALAAAALAGCTLYADDGSSSAGSTPTDPNGVNACVTAAIADCYAAQLPADECADVVIQRCNLDPGGPDDPACHDQVLTDCLDAGGDPMSCELRATEACGGGGGCPSYDPDCDPSTPPDPACHDQVFRDCLANGGDPLSCEQFATDVCTTGGGCPSGDPSCDPGGGGGGDPACHDQVLRDCLVNGGDPMTCEVRANEACGGGSGDGCPSYDPNCDPGTPDPTCQELLIECLNAGIDPVTCEERAAACTSGPGCPAGDPRCDPGCDPSDPSCDPGCPAGDPTCNSGDGDPVCFDQEFYACLASTNDPGLCAERAAALCGEPSQPSPGDPSAP